VGVLWRSASSEQRAYLGLAALSTGVFLGALDQTVVVTALPSIILDLDVPFTRLNEAAWIVTAYLLGYTVAMPLVGRMSDLWGRGRVYAACLGLFAVTSIACGAARSLEVLILARGLQAVGGGALLPVTLAAAGDLFTERRRTLLLGVVGAAAEAGGVLGPLYGAAVMEVLDWRWIFYLNLPFSAAILGATLLSFRPGAEAAPQSKVDYVGAALIGTSLGMLALGLSREVGQAGTPAVHWELVAGSAGLLVAFVAWELRARPPLIDPRMFRAAPFAAGNLVSLLSGAALIVAMVDVPLWSATIQQRSASEGGLLLMRMTAAIPAGALLGGLLSRRLDYRSVTCLGLLACAGGLWLLGGWTADTAAWRMTRDLVLAGLGFGLLLAPLTAVVVAWAGSERAGVASALVTVMRMIGMMVGLSALTAWGLARFNVLVAKLPLPFPVEGEDPLEFGERLGAYQEGVLSASLTVFGEVFTAAAVLCLVALVPALFLRGTGPDGQYRTPNAGVRP
jgi:EmrB/QacA subfamily drug resistance transporter